MSGLWSACVPARERLLVIEDEALIALDIQGVIEEALAQRATVIQTYDQALPLVDRFNEFSLAVVTPPRSAADRVIANRLVEAGVEIVVCSAAMVDLSRTPLAGSPAVDKPFTDDDLLAACRAAIARKSR